MLKDPILSLWIDRSEIAGGVDCAPTETPGPRTFSISFQTTLPTAKAKRVRKLTVRTLIRGLLDFESRAMKRSFRARDVSLRHLYEMVTLFFEPRSQARETRDSVPVFCGGDEEPERFLLRVTLFIGKRGQAPEAENGRSVRI
jgi:hypothetical protein